MHFLKSVLNSQFSAARRLPLYAPLAIVQHYVAVHSPTVLVLDNITPYLLVGSFVDIALAATKSTEIKLDISQCYRLHLLSLENTTHYLSDWMKFEVAAHIKAGLDFLSQLPCLSCHLPASLNSLTVPFTLE